MSSEANPWLPDEDPHVARVEGRFTSIGSAFLYRVHMESSEWLDLPRPSDEVLRDAYRTDAFPDVPLGAFAKAEPGEYLTRAQRLFDQLSGRRLVTVWDARNLADAVTSKWFGEGRLSSRAQRSALQGYLTGRIQAGVSDPRARYERLQAAMSDITAPDPGGVRRAQYARERAAELVTNLREEARKRLALNILDHEVTPNRQPAQLQERISSDMATLNRDWRRIALTETSMNRSHGFLSGVKPGEIVKWSAAEDACIHCRRYHDQEFEVVMEPMPSRFHQVVWVGKTNKDRSFHKRKITGEKRTLDELAGPTIPAHPHCRCRWIRVGERGVLDESVEDLLAHIATLD